LTSGLSATALATRLASDHGVAYVGYYLSTAGLVTLISLLLIEGA